VCGSKRTGSRVSVRATTASANLATLTQQLSEILGENQDTTRWKRVRQGSVANSPRLIVPLAIASSNARLRR
jgi:hypothetical protein